tara:strand:- start:679 stop:1854 length:1176 start_codon:yes stop_codon:yes gene_type:complete
MKIKNNAFILIFSILVFISGQENFLVADHLEMYDGEINLNGTIINGTDKNKVTEYTIKLMGTQNSSTELIEVDSLKTFNEFKFSNFKIDESFTYFLMISHEEIPTIVFLEEIDDQYEIEIIVYDREFIPENISVIDYSIMIPHLSPDSNVISILGLISFENTGDKTFYADLSDPNLSGLNLLRFSLPENFENLSVDSDLPPGNVMQIPTGFALSNPVPPGQHQILYSYSMPRNTTALNYNVRLPFGAKKFKLLAPEKTEINNNEILTKEATKVDEKKYEVLSGDDIKKGDILNIEINKIATPSIFSKFSYFVEKNTISVLIGSSSALILFILGVFAIYKNSLLNKNSTNNIDEVLISKIIDLDERFKKNNINEEEYNILRKSYKERIKGKF